MSFSIKRFVIAGLPFRQQIKKIDLLFVNVKHVIQRKAFYCNALSGKSDYNICVNSDMTVSCNCVDIDGSGHIGDLRLQTLEEIFDGGTATRFRKSLSRGIIPIKRCLTCRELVSTHRAEAASYVSEYTTPTRGIMVENTVQCNLTCSNCSRKSILKTRKRLRMSLGDMELVAKCIQSCKIRLINFFNLGEPFMSDTIHEELAVLKKYNPNTPIYISTNGLLLNKEKRVEAALLADYIFISLDGATDESVRRYQVGGSFETSYKNMKELVRARRSRNQEKPVIDWKYVVFSWNDSESEIMSAIQYARDAHVDILSFWPGEGSPAQISSRFRNDEFFKNLGSESWKGREIDFRKTDSPSSG